MLHRQHSTIFLTKNKEHKDCDNRQRKTPEKGDISAGVDYLNPDHQKKNLLKFHIKCKGTAALSSLTSSHPWEKSMKMSRGSSTPSRIFHYESSMKAVYKRQEPHSCFIAVLKCADNCRGPWHTTYTTFIPLSECSILLGVDVPWAPTVVGAFQYNYKAVV